MSKVIKGIGKVFKTILKVAPIVIGIGAAVFTAGASLGLTVGWGAAAASISSTLGLSGTLGTVVTGALTQAGFGALTGAAVSGVTGGNVLKGAQTGAAVGAVTGGLTGLLSPGSVATKPDSLLKSGNAGGAGQTAANASKITVSDLPPPTGPAADALPTAGAPTVAPQVANPAAPIKAASWLDRNPTAAGMIAQGAGTGLLSLAQSGDAKATAKIGEERDQAAADRTAANYGTGNTGLLAPNTSYINQQAARPTPGQAYTYDFEYQWDPQQRRLVKVSIQKA